MIEKSIAATLIFLIACSGARAQNCRDLPPGPARFECASRKHPDLIAKRERCKEEGLKMGLSGGRGNAGGLRNYVQACAQRR